MLSEGANDDTIATFARENGSVVLTHDPDFLDPETRAGVPVLYYADDTMDSSEIVGRVAELIEWVPDPADLPPLTSLNEWE